VTDPGILTPPFLPIVTAALDDRGWQYTVVDEPRHLRFRVSGEHVTCLLTILVEDDKRLVNILGTAGLIVPSEARARARKLIEAANQTDLLGSFTFDSSEHEIVYSNPIDVDRRPFTVGLVAGMISNVIYMLDLWYPAMVQVISLGVSVGVAVDDVDRRIEEGLRGYGGGGGLVH